MPFSAIMSLTSNTGYEDIGFKTTDTQTDRFTTERRGSSSFVTYLERRWIQVAVEGNLSGIIALLEQDPNLVTKQDFVMSALHWAAKKGRKDIVDVLTSTGMDVNIKSGYTALHLAAIHGHENVISSLFDCDADIDARDYSGRKPKHYIKDSASLWIQKKLGKQITPPVLVTPGDTLDKGLRNVGAMFLEMKTMSNSLGTGLDKLDSEPETILPPATHKTRSSSFVKIYKTVAGKFKENKPLKLDIPDNTRYYRTGRARSAPDINHITTWSPRVVHVIP